MFIFNIKMAIFRTFSFGFKFLFSFYSVRLQSF